MEKYIWLHKYLLPPGCLCLVPRGSNLELHYQIIDQNEPLRLIILINSQWREIQTCRLLITDVMENEDMSTTFQFFGTGDEYEGEGEVCDRQIYGQTIKYVSSDVWCSCFPGNQGIKASLHSLVVL